MTGSPGKPIPYVPPPKPKGIQEKLAKIIKRTHLNYNMVTSLYMMEPMERAIINCLLMLAITLMLYSSWVYLPHYTWRLLVFTGILPAPEGTDIFDDPEAIFIGKSEL